MIRRIPDQSALPPEADQRRTKRINTSGTDCSLGEILDVSASGMRVLRKGNCKAQVGQEQPIILKTIDGIYRYLGRIAHIQKIGFRRHVLGVEIVEASEEGKRQLLLIARTAPLTAGFNPLPPMNEIVEKPSNRAA